jgi:hypothetical protein
MPDDGGDDEKEKEEDDPDDEGVNGGQIHRSNVDFNISRDVFSHAEAEKKLQEEEENDFCDGEDVRFRRWKVFAMETYSTQEPKTNSRHIGVFEE